MSILPSGPARLSVCCGASHEGPEPCQDSVPSPTRIGGTQAGVSSPPPARQPGRARPHLRRPRTHPATAVEATGLTTSCRSRPSAAPGEGDQFRHCTGPAEVRDAADQSATTPGPQVLHISWSARSPATNERGEDERVGGRRAAVDDGGRGSVTALSHRSHQLYGLPRTVRPDLAQHTRPWIDWTPLDGRYGLCHVVPRTHATSIRRRPSSRPQSLPRTKPRDRKDPDRTRTNRATRNRCTTSRRRTCWFPELS
jgi:hypothetical protein